MQSDYKTIPIRTSAVLTTSYVAGTKFIQPEILPEVQNQIVLYVDFTLGSLTTAELIVEFSADNTNFYQESYELVPTAGVAVCTTYTRQLTATGKYRFAIPIKDKVIQVSVKGTGTVTGSLLAITGIIGTD